MYIFELLGKHLEIWEKYLSALLVALTSVLNGAERSTLPLEHSVVWQRLFLRAGGQKIGRTDEKMLSKT